MKCREISADWAAQRIKGLSLGGAIRSAVKPKWVSRMQSGGVKAKTLIESFRYPKLGPGQMWDAAADQIRAGAALARLLPEWAERFEDSAWKTIPAGDLENGDRIRVKVGEAFPADGVLLGGATDVDEADTEFEVANAAQDEGA